MPINEDNYRMWAELNDTPVYLLLEDERALWAIRLQDCDDETVTW